MFIKKEHQRVDVLRFSIEYERNELSGGFRCAETVLRRDTAEKRMGNDSV